MNELVPLPPAAARLRALTHARVGLGRTGVSQQLRDVLAFQLAHAQARDAVHAHLESAALAGTIAGMVPANRAASVVRLHSAAPDRTTYLQRPDLGRKLDQPSARTLREIEPSQFELVLIVVDGLSALAVERHVPPLLVELLPRLSGWAIAPLFIVEQGRVAIGDEIGLGVRAEMSVVLIGERPGLSSPDSLGAYTTWHPRPGRTDAERNCVSNIRAEGLSYKEAADQLVKGLTWARRRQLTGATLDQASRMIENAQDDGGEQ